jgi:Ca2+-binding EF-hand superfamily protein
VSVNKKDLKKTFDIMDRMKTGRIRLDEIKSISATLNEDNDELERPSDNNTK